MFKCKACGKQSNSGEKQYSKIVETRKKYYEGGGFGWEIVKEIKVCESCMENSCLTE